MFSPSNKEFSTLPRKRINTSETPTGKQSSPNMLQNISLGSANNLNALMRDQIQQLNHKRAQSVNGNENHSSFPPLKNDLLEDLS